MKNPLTTYFKLVSLLFFNTTIPKAPFQLLRKERQTIYKLCGWVLLLSLCPGQHDNHTPELESPMASRGERPAADAQGCIGLRVLRVSHQVERSWGR